jgi:predicted HicB family RNase H-like nuclease
MSKTVATLSISRPSAQRELRAARRYAGDIDEVKLSVRVPRTLRARLKVIAAERGQDMQQVVIAALTAQHPELNS